MNTEAVMRELSTTLENIRYALGRRLARFGHGGREATPLIVFIHVPKTGGTSVNKLLKYCSCRGYTHCEQMLGPHFTQVVKDADWISGHVPFSDFKLHLDGVGRKTEFFSAVRDPLSQILSHLNWIFAQNARGISPGAAAFETDLHAVDFSSERSVTDYLHEYRDVFFSFQSRYVLGGDFEFLSEDEVDRRLDEYAFIATEHDFPRLFRAFNFNWLPDSASDIRENIAGRYFDASIACASLQRFINKHDFQDKKLYARVRDRNWARRAPRPSRSTRFRCEAATRERFDERAYLDANPDVDAAVRVGVFPSGRAHFEQLGRTEGRLMRQLGTGERVMRRAAAHWRGGDGARPAPGKPAHPTR
ncbi:MAG: hypothetical protein N2444_08445 [Methylocystis sp.]|nr:hypothetical protein [Methylocystis sp.]